MRRTVTTEAWDTGTYAAPTSTLGTAFGLANSGSSLFDSVATLPALAQGNRRFNLNLPLPVSDNPSEPTRQKYVRELYHLFKCVSAPPDGSSLTAPELAALGQFAVNIVDFRDPDATMTKFLNYDLTLANPITTNVPTNVANDYSGSAATPIPVVTQPASASKVTSYPNSNPLVQWGMEYNPVAITEVLGFQYTRKDTTTSKPTATPRLFVELINTLTQDYYTGNNGTASNLDLNGWGFIITRDDPSDTVAATAAISPVERPNIVTGQLSPTTISTYFVPLAGTGMGSTASPMPLTPTLTAMNSATTAVTYVMGNAPLATGANGGEAGTPTTSAPISTSLISQIAQSTVAIPASSAPTLSPKPNSYFYWLHLLRPENPNNPNDALIDANGHPTKVVVDSFRFPYVIDQGWYDSSVSTNEVFKQAGPNAIYSVRRKQPYRGGHFIPYADQFNDLTSGKGFPNPYGATEQTEPASTLVASFLNNVILTTTSGSVTKQITAPIYHSLGSFSADDNWDHFVFHDRDFSSVAEVMLVPACPPGLFTKLFVEQPNPVPFSVTSGAITTGSYLPPASPTTPAPTVVPPGYEPNLQHYFKPPFEASPTIGITGDANYVAGSAITTTPPTIGQYAFNGQLNTTTAQRLPDPVAFPYLAEGFYYSRNQNYYIDPTVASPVVDTTKTALLNSKRTFGWYQFLEFLEVPSTAYGYIGPVAAGQNADWARQDLRPGLMNLNLMVDEEAFFGALDDPRLNTSTVTSHVVAVQTVDSNYPVPNFPAPGTTTTYPIGTIGVPQVATAVYATGMPSYTVPMKDRGYSTGATSSMKAAFSDFLKLRDGGSGLVFSPFSTSPYNALFGIPDPNSSNYTAMPSRPFRSLANNFQSPSGSLFNVDINDTVMRPARLPVFQLSINLPNDSSGNPQDYVRNDLAVHPTGQAVAPAATPNLPASPAALTPHIPPRRLFQIPDFDPMSIFTPSATYPNVSYDPAADPLGSPPTPPLTTPAYTPIVPENSPIRSSSDGDHIFLYNSNADLFVNADATIGFTNGYQGSGTVVGTTADHRWHPYFRTEMLSKVMNQTTIRTHQYAVWLTVGFFEVVKEGNKQMFNQYDPLTGASMAVDQLGKELNADAGKQVRYRYYFLVDRTKAAGFNPSSPGDFRELVTYRRRIE
jgi:hypothetical protein